MRREHRVLLCVLAVGSLLFGILMAMDMSVHADRPDADRVAVHLQ
ncbi:MAG: hypothetical protein ACM30I_10945 [Gemmatimonas sp.]